jgi:ribosomal-protein-alanine N-acetyltransferase
MDVALRRLRTEDISQIIEIEREAFTPLWLGTAFKRELNNKFARYLVAYEMSGESQADESSPETPERPADSSLWGRMVKGVQGALRRDNSDSDSAFDADLAGYVGIWFQGDEAHITEIAVRENRRGLGIGELLLIGTVRVALERGSTVVTLEARVSNFIAQRLYEKYGFDNVGTRKAYYSDNREDAVIMTTSPIHSDEYQQMFRELQEIYLSRWRAITIDS